MHLAQLNIAVMKYPRDDERIADFFNALDSINELAESHQGFIWRYEESEDEPDDLFSFFGIENTHKSPGLLVNMSVWQDHSALMNYAYRTDHAQYFKRRAEWFHKLEGPHMVLWHVEEGHIPDFAEARDKLSHYREHGNTDESFDFRRWKRS